MKQLLTILILSLSNSCFAQLSIGEYYALSTSLKKAYLECENEDEKAYLAYQVWLYNNAKTKVGVMVQGGEADSFEGDMFALAEESQFIDCQSYTTNYGITDVDENKLKECKTYWFVEQPSSKGFTEFKKMFNYQPSIDEN